MPDSAMQTYNRSTANRSVYREELSPLLFIERAATAHRDRVAVRDGLAEYRYGEWRARAVRLAAALRRAGLQKGDRIVFVSPPCEPLLLAHFAVPMAGGVLVALDVGLGPETVGRVIEQVDARLVFTAPELGQTLARVRGGVRRQQLGAAFEDFLAAAGNWPVEVDWPESEYEVLSIRCSPRAGGAFHGAMLHHRGACLSALSTVLETRLERESRFLWTAPMQYGWCSCFAWAVAAAGASQVCPPPEALRDLWRLIETERITHALGTPAILEALVASAPGFGLRRRLVLSVAGAAPPPAMVARLAELNVAVIHAYGLAETGGPFAVGEAGGAAGRLGAPHLLAGQLRVVDEEMRAVPNDGRTPGELVMRGNVVMKGYYREDEETADAFRGGWLHTGDMAVVHADGSVQLIDSSVDR